MEYNVVQNCNARIFLTAEQSDEIIIMFSQICPYRTFYQKTLENVDAKFRDKHNNRILFWIFYLVNHISDTAKHEQRSVHICNLVDVFINYVVFPYKAPL
jgi:hypothetical protein